MAFDTSGDLDLTQEIGTFQGDWAASTNYGQRDIVKDTNNNNIYIANTAHTSSGSVPLSSNADIAKWDLLVDAAAAATSATNAAASATSASTAQTAAEAAQTAAETAQTAAETAETNAETAQTAAETAQTAAETAQTAAETAYDNFDDRYLGAKSSDPTVDNDGDALIDGALYFDTTNNVMKVYDLGGTAWNRTTPTSAEQTNIDTVSGISANVTTVAGISANVTTVAGVSADVTTVAGVSSDVTTVAGVSTNVTTVAGVSSDVTTVAGISSNVTTVAGISANVTTVAGDTTNIGTVATDLSGSDNIGTVAGSISNVNSVGGSIANVNTVATNLSGVNSFAERYRVGASDPTTSLDEGDLFFNTTSNAYKFYDGSQWNTVNVSGIGSVADDTTPQLGGNLDLNSNNISGTGNVTVTGAVTATSYMSIGSDDTGSAGLLSVYGGTSGEGGEIRLYASAGEDTTVDHWSIDLATDDLRFFNNLGDLSAEFIVNGGVKLRYDNSVKFETTSTGIDVTGTAEVDTLSIGGTEVTATAAELNYLDITTLGTSQASKAVTADSSGDVTLSEELKAKSYNETYVSLSGSTPTVNCENGNMFALSTTANTTFTFSNPPASGTGYGFILKLTAGGTHSITWPTSVDWASATAPDDPASGETDILAFITHDGGTTWYGFRAGYAMG
jgi:hypothetical protein